MTIPLGALCSTGRIVEDVRHALFRGQATNSHIRVHPEQPQGEDAFGYAFADIMNNCAEPKQYEVAGKKHLLEAGFQVSDSDEDPLPSEEDEEVSRAAPPYIERICYTTFNYRAGYTADNHVYAKETIMAAFREYTPSPFLPTPLRPSLWVVLTVNLVMYREHGNTPAQSLRSAVIKPIVSTVQRNKIVSLPLAGTVASPKLHGLVLGVLAQQQKRAGGIIKHNTNAVKNLAATQAVPGDNVDEGSSPEPPANKAKQPAKPAAGGLARGRSGAGARAGGGALGSRAGRRAAVAAAATHEQQAGRRGGFGQNRM
eukprot:jgi/Tetstr1/448341/TSEL_035625.t1